MNTEEWREKEFLCMLREIKEKCPLAWPDHAISISTGSDGSNVVFYSGEFKVSLEVGYSVLERHFQKLADFRGATVVATENGYAVSWKGFAVDGHRSRLQALCTFILSVYSEKKPDPKATKTPTLEDLSRRLEAVERRMMEK